MPAIGGAAWPAEATEGSRAAASTEDARNHPVAWRARGPAGGIPGLDDSWRSQVVDGKDARGRAVGRMPWHNLRPGRPQLRRTIPSLVAIGLLFTTAASAQEMEPRTFSPSPVGTNFVVFAVNRASGSVLVDPSLPVTDIHASN